MMILVHAKAGQKMAGLPMGFLKEKDFIVLMGPDGSFEKLDLPAPAGAVGGVVIRVTQMQDGAGAFAALADCSRLLYRILAEHMGPLHYVQPLSEQLPDMEIAPVAWTATPDGHVNAFRLSAMVASSPLLMSLTRDLSARPMTDDRRFAFLAAAFAGA
ncbi:hypothetical protein [Paracoccus sp. Ld10]|uniref:hypothetical protein n=1 Tax=Paracoccus sp. Ld10 TaxID=649158 RepID=UPI00386C1CE7